MSIKLTQLSSKIKCSWSLNYNDHKNVYEKAEQYYEDYDDDEKVGEIDFSKDIYSIQVYYLTPIGFYRGISNDLDKLIEWAVEVSDD